LIRGAEGAEGEAVVRVDGEGEANGDQADAPNDYEEPEPVEEVR
jgi:hypothetical protein